MPTALKLPLLSLLLATALAPASRADGFGISYFKKTKHGGFGIHYADGHRHRGHGHHHGHGCFAPGRYETVREKVWVPGGFEDVWVDPVYEYRRDVYGRTFPICVAAGHHERVAIPGRYEIRERRVWVPGRCRC